MKKLLSLLLICIMLSCSLAGCGETSSGIDFVSIAGRPFVLIPTDGGVGYNEYILVDINEKTQYYYFTEGNGGRAITLLVDSEGKPLLYEGEIPYYGSEVGK